MNALLSFLALFNKLEQGAAVAGNVIQEGLDIVATLTDHPAHQTFLATMGQKFAEDPALAQQALHSVGALAVKVGATISKAASLAGVAVPTIPVVEGAIPVSPTQPSRNDGGDA